MIIINTGGITHKHEKEVEVGDIWTSIYPKHTAIFVTSVHQMYVEYYYMEGPSDILLKHKSDFYSFFKRVQ